MLIPKWKSTSTPAQRRRRSEWAKIAMFHSIPRSLKRSSIAMRRRNPRGRSSMALNLDLTIRFLTDRYHGGDWPPSPARLFQALVAGAKAGPANASWEARHQSALEWLEQRPNPEIFARPTVEGQKYTLFVPNNSLDK